jgi:hypothetical protein
MAVYLYQLAIFPCNTAFQGYLQMFPENMCVILCRWATPDNPHGIWRPAISNSTLVLHYAYSSPGDVAVKAGRSCPRGVVEAVLAGNTSQVCW